MTDTDAHKVDTFHTKNLRKIMKIFWPLTITNEVVLQKCGSLPMSQTIMKCRWTWIGHVLRQDKESLAKTALYWTHEGKRRRGRPKTTWQRTVEAEMWNGGKTWGQLSWLAEDCSEWRNCVAALCAWRHNRQYRPEGISSYSISMVAPTTATLPPPNCSLYGYRPLISKLHP